MAFSTSLLYIDRGNYNNDISESVFAYHRYGISTDTFATIEGAGYFPALLGATSAEVKVNDRLEIIDSTNARQIYSITTVNPLTVTLSETPLAAELIVHTTSWGGAFSTPITGDNITIYKIGRNIVAHFSDVIGTADSATTINATVNLPSTLAPDAPLGEQLRPILVTDNTTEQTGRVAILTSGSITISSTIAGASFAGAGLTGFGDFYISWIA